MKLKKDLLSLSRPVQLLLGGSLVLIVVALLWPRSKHFVELVPVDVPGSKTRLYAAKVENFDNSNDPHFVMFYAPWCGYCKKTMPEWEKLQHSKVKVMKVNCDDDKELATLHGIKGFPTIRFLPKGLKNPQSALEYQGDRTASDMLSYIEKCIAGTPSDMPNQAAPVPGGPRLPRERAGMGPLTTSFVARNFNES